MTSQGVTGLSEIGERVSLRQRVAESLRAALVSGRMAPGTTYSIPALAEQFGVSATPVREAMLDLVNEGGGSRVVSSSAVMAARSRTAFLRKPHFSPIWQSSCPVSALKVQRHLSGPEQRSGQVSATPRPRRAGRHREQPD